MQQVFDNEMKTLQKMVRSHKLWREPGEANETRDSLRSAVRVYHPSDAQNIFEPDESKKLVKFREVK